MSYEAWGEPPDMPCAVCGGFDDQCVCDECPACGMIGDAKCYEEHGMVRTEEQIDSAARRLEPPFGWDRLDY